MQWVRKIRETVGLNRLPKIVRRIIIGVIGGTIVLFGVALIFLPGPGSIVIPIGLVILATEFAWARYAVRRGKYAVQTAKQKWEEAVQLVRPPR